MMKEGDNSVQISIQEWEQRENGRTNNPAVAVANNTTRINQISPTQVGTTSVNRPPSATNLAGNVAKFLFFAHLLALAILVTFLAIRGFLRRSTSFHPAHWHLPLLASATTSALAALLWLVITLSRPSLALKVSLWLSPSLACCTAFLLLADGTGRSLSFAAIFLVLAMTQALYACWVVPRLSHACQILSASVSAVKPSLALAKCMATIVLAGLLYSSFWTLGAGGLAAAGSGFAPIFVLVLVLSLAWTMQVLRYMVHVAVARVAYARLAWDSEADTGEAFRVAAGELLGDVCLGAAVAPAVAAARGGARAMGAVAGGSDEFLFSCASCYMGVADRLVARGNRWGLVHVGAHGKRFGEASADTWEMFGKQGMSRLIDKDLTGSFCFLSGVAGGAAAALTGGPWVLAAAKGYTTELTVYAFLIGYFMIRIAMAWAQACVAAYHVAYADDPQNHRLGSLIPDRIRELQLSPD